MNRPLSMILSAVLISGAMMTTKASSTWSELRQTGLSVPASAAAEQPEKLKGTLTGVVTDEEGEPLPGATVMIKGTTVGTATNIDGKFTLNVDVKNPEITVNYVGMAPYSLKLKASDFSSPLTIVLSQNASMMDEVVVVAFGEQKRSSFTGAAGVVKSDDIKKMAVNDPVQAMAGKLAGVQMNVSSGSPTATPSIQIRGTGSINASNEPLYIVDGSPMEGSSYMLNPEDIESITVLKDAASNALYGARGANGVVMITTKKGQAGKARITANMKVGFINRAVQEYDKIDDPKAFYETHYQALYNYNTRMLGQTPYNAHVNANETLFKDTDAGGLGYVTFTAPDGQFLIGSNGKMNPGATLGRVVENNGAQYTIIPDDWIKESFRTGLRQDYSVNVAGGVQKMNYYATLGYLRNEGIVRGNDMERYTFRLKTDWQLRDWLNFGTNIGYARINYNAADTGSNSTFGMASWLGPIYPVYLRDGDGNIMYDDNGKMYDYGNGTLIGVKRPFLNGSNPIQANQLETSFRNRGLLNIGGNLNISVPWVKGLKLQIKTDVMSNTSNYTSTQQPFYGSSATTYPKGYVRQNADNVYSYNHQQLLTYVRQFGPHNVNVLLGHEYYRTTEKYISAAKKDMFSYWGNQNLDGAVTVVNTSISGYTSVYNTEGWFARAMYDFEDRYFLSASYRRDASSIFHPDHRWGNFYSVGAAWIMSKESWFPKNEAINMLKIKASWGQQGNDGIAGYLYTTTYSISNVNGDVGLTMSSVKGSKDITWETNGNFNAGVEFELFNNRLTGDIEFFNRKTTDMLSEISVPLDAGYYYKYDNVGDMRNLGVEITLGFDVIRNKDLSWNIYANATHYKNKILKLSDDNKSADLDGHPGYTYGNYFYGEGLSIHSFRLRKFAGVDHNTGEALYYVQDEETGELSTTKTLSDASYFYCGTSDPTLYGGFGTTLSFKGIDFSAQFQYSIGGKAIDNGYITLMHNPSSGYTSDAYHKDILNAWSETNRDSNIPRFQYTGGNSIDNNANATTDRFLMNASTLSLQNIVIGYTFPSKLMRRAGIDKLRIYASGDNLCYWSKRKGFDPRNTFWGSPSTTGYSLTRTFTFGLELGF